MYLRLSFVRTVGQSHGSPSTCVSSRRGRPQCSPAGAGISAGVARSFGGGAVGALWLPWEIGRVQTSVREGHPESECSLRRHLDSVGPDRPRAVYQVVNVNTDSEPKVA